jgi:hypothetical protein
VVRVREEAESVVVRGFVKGLVSSVSSVSSRSSSRVIRDEVYKGCRRCRMKYIWSVGGVGYPLKFYFFPPYGTLGGTLHPLHLFLLYLFLFQKK